MSQTIKKLNNLKNPESFIQINTIKGYKYVDRAGEIVNAYHKKNSVPRFVMTLNGLAIEQPMDKVDELKITPRIVWAKFSEIDSLDMVANLFSKEVEKILGIIEVEKVNRVGWRNFFVYEFPSKEKQEEYLKKFSIIENTKTLFTRLEIETKKDFDANLVLQPVIKDDEQKTHGILFDVDVFQNKEVEPKEISGILKKFREYLADKDGFLNLINKTFE
jgi:hypothetical protein